MEENAKGLDKKQTVLKATGKKRCRCNCDKNSNLLQNEIEENNSFKPAAGFYTGNMPLDLKPTL